jgi:hypothetical protein
MAGIDEVILWADQAKKVGIAIATSSLFNEVSLQKNQSEWLVYFITAP